MREIRCRGKVNGQACNRFLGEVEGTMVRIYCPKCQGRHEVPIVELIAALEAHLAEVRERAEEMGGGKGFML